MALSLSSNQKSIPVEYVELSESEEAEALATIDPIAGMAAADHEQLRALIEEVEQADQAVAGLLSDLYTQGLDHDAGSQSGQEITCPSCGHTFGS